MKAASPNSGISLIELMLAMAAVGALMITTNQVLLQLKKTEKSAVDDLSILADQRLLSSVLRNDLRRMAPSFNALSSLSDAPYPNEPFFELSLALSCSDTLPQCRRTRTLARPTAAQPNASFIVMIEARNDGMSSVYDPSNAYSWPNYVALNRNGAVNNLPPADPGRFIDGKVFLLRSLSESIVKQGPHDRCYCTGQTVSPLQFNCSQAQSGGQNANCGGSAEVPYVRPSIYVGYASGVQANPNGGDLVKIPASGDALDTLIRFQHPAASSTVFGQNPDTFLRSLPPMDAMNTRARLIEVHLIKYELTPKGEFLRSRWVGGGAQPWGPMPVRIADRVAKVTFRRDSISLPAIGFKIDFDNQP